MTIKELYNWAVERGLEDAELEAQYADDGGFYIGSRCLEIEELEIEEHLGYTSVIV